MFKNIFILVLLLSFSCVSNEKSDKHILKSGDRKVLTYNAAYIPSPKASAPWFGRSGFIHPVLTPSGKTVTTPFPSDHLHQHGIMFAWTSGRIEGRKVDFWNSKRIEGKVEHVETVSASGSKIVVKLRHIDIKGNNQVAINETWEITKVDHPKLNVFELKSIQIPILKNGVDIAEYHYGALCVRSINGFTAITSEGKDRLKANHSKPDWVAWTGKVDGEDCGIVGIQHKNNFRYPQAVRIHPKMPYFCFAPMVDGAFKLEYSKPYVSKFRFIAFDGKINAEEIDEIAKDFNK